MNEHQKQFIKLLNDVSYRKSSVLSDWAEMAAISIQNAVSPHDAAWQEREDRYLRTQKKYSKEESESLAHMLACITLSLEENNNDALGEIYMSDKVASRGRWDSDVCFTPYHLSYMIAKMTFSDFKMPERGWFTVCEPASGTGGMVIAAAAVLREQGINYQQTMHVHAVDVRAELAYMTYIQLSLLHIPAVVIHGNTLSLEEWSVWRTPAHMFGMWPARVPATLKGIPIPQPTPTTVIQQGQLALFQIQGDDNGNESTESKGSTDRKSKVAVPRRAPRGNPPADTPRSRPLLRKRTPRRAQGD